MSRALTILNAAAVVALSALCALQWSVNRKLNLQLRAAEETRIGQSAEIDKAKKSIAGLTADLDTFRAQLQSSARATRQSDDKLRKYERELAQLQADRDQLKQNIARWSDAVAERDAQLKTVRAQVESLAAGRNEAVEKFNELAAKHNSTVDDLNKRNEAFNALVTRYNALVESTRQK